MKKNITKDQKGFTIIEVLIVLAIAGLIILIVLLAVPALQRNSRNTQRKNDVSAIGGAFSEYVNNNGGQVPTAAQFTANVLPNSKLSFYAAGSVRLNPQTSPAVPSTNVPAAGANDVMELYTDAKCADATTATATGATARSVIALYRVETGGGDQLQCQEL
jgi:prepilin-type N-terminal cleavage/methylation domain-containing protein